MSTSQTEIQPGFKQNSLTVRRVQGRGGKLDCDCECGGTRTVSRHELLRNRAIGCLKCAKARRKLRVNPRKGVSTPAPVQSEYIRDWRQYLAKFNYRQRERFDELMTGRQGNIAQSEAVDVVMREPLPGVCCTACLAKIMR